MTQKRYNLSEIANQFFGGDQEEAQKAIRNLQVELAFQDAGGAMQVGDKGGVQITVSSCKFLKIEEEAGKYTGICMHRTTVNAFNREGKRICGPFFGGHPSSVCKESRG